MITKNRKLILKTRSIFNYTIKSRKKRYDFGVDWLKVVDTLDFKENWAKTYHVDHIIPLNTFNFLHEDNSINNIAIKMAWSPANLRLLTKEDNMIKNRWENTAKFPPRFEYIFDDERYVKELYSFFENLRKKDVKEEKEFFRNLKW